MPSVESIQIILPVISIIFLLLTFKKSVYGVISYFIAVNGKLGEMYSVLAAIRFELLVAIVVLFSIFFKGNAIGKISPGKNTLNKAVWILFFIGMLSVLQAVDVSESWSLGGYNLLKMIIFYVMIVCSVNETGDLEKIIWSIVIMSAWIAYEPVVNYLGGVGRDHGYGVVASGRFGAAQGHVGLANVLNQTIPLTIFWAISRKAKKGFFFGFGDCDVVDHRRRFYQVPWWLYRFIGMHYRFDLF